MADEGAAVSEELHEIQAPGSRAEAIAAIDDTIVRRFVRVAVHVRGYAPYYAATVALFGFLAFGPRPDGGNRSEDALGRAASAAGASAAGANGSSTTRTTGASTTPLSAPAAGTLFAGATGGDLLSGLTGGIEDGFAVAGDAVASGPTLPEAPGTPDFGTFDPGDVDYGTDLPEACTVALPSPAPSVSPSREIDGLQTTIEAAAGVEAPADLGPYAEDAATAAGCPNVGDTVPVPALPLPGLPI